MQQEVWEKLTPAEKKKQLFLEQKHTLELFLERGAISQVQFDKSFGDLKPKMEVTWKEVETLPTLWGGFQLFQRSNLFPYYSSRIPLIT